MGNVKDYIAVGLCILLGGCTLASVIPSSSYTGNFQDISNGNSVIENCQTLCIKYSSTNCVSDCMDTMSDDIRLANDTNYSTYSLTPITN